jgi:hypothetical protein
VAELLDLLKNALDDDTVGAIAKRFGLGPDQASEAVGVGLPWDTAAIVVAAPPPSPPGRRSTS